MSERYEYIEAKRVGVEALARGETFPEMDEDDSTFRIGEPCLVIGNRKTALVVQGTVDELTWFVARLGAATHDLGTTDIGIPDPVGVDLTEGKT